MNLKQLGVLVFISMVLGMNVVASKALAQEEPSIRFGEAIASPGCVVADQLGEDGRTLVVTFEDFETKDGTRKTCNIRVETFIPSGFSVQNLEALYQGSAEVPSGTEPATLSRSYSFIGGAFGITTTPAQTTEFTSSQPLFAVQDDVDVLSASCGGQGTLGVNMVAQSQKGNSIIFDTADLVRTGLTIRFDLAPC